MNANKNLYVISVYSSRTLRRTPAFIAELEKIFCKLNLNRSANYYILAGDLNARHVE
ncbi:hypothetical protein WH47_08376 [Habropoda laboriosa]|uniref:Endonuclease/exonuclease/phosphatase domain-containing protein n=1 Tax=Habropoda laboriosa TaxID=597456 RepID=A0A0L7RGY1_9HYME|nr:hypothetical protein WH47_08376 [Habropoda laboriosa]